MPFPSLQDNIGQLGGGDSLGGNTFGQATQLVPDIKGFINPSANAYMASLPDKKVDGLPEPKFIKDDQGKIETLIFPADLTQSIDNRHFIAITIKELSRGRADATTLERTDTIIYLPVIPISSSFGANWNGISGDALDQAVFNKAGDIRKAVDEAVDTGFKTVQQVIGGNYTGARDTAIGGVVGAGAKAWDSISENVKNGNVKEYIKGKAIQGLQGIIPATNFYLAGINTAVRNFEVQQFSGMNFREFQFSWKLIAKNATESQTIRAIQDRIKLAMHPELNGSLENFMSYPNKLNIEFYSCPLESTLDEQFTPTLSLGTPLINETMPKMAPCVITGFNVNYHSSGVGFHRNTDAVTEIDITLAVRETEIIFRDQIRTFTRS